LPLFDKLTTGLENLPATAAFVLSLSKDGQALRPLGPGYSLARIPG
jgi:hypothetical protein